MGDDPTRPVSPPEPLQEWIDEAQAALDRDGQSDWDITREAAEVVAIRLWNDVAAGVLPLPANCQPDWLKLHAEGPGHHYNLADCRATLDAARAQDETGPTEPCPTCMQPVPVPQRGDHDYGLPLRAQDETGLRAAAQRVMDSHRKGYWSADEMDALEVALATPSPATRE